MHRSATRFDRDGLAHLAAICRELAEPMAKGKTLKQANTEPSS